MKSPLSDEGEIRHDRYGRAERVTVERLRGDFAHALKTMLRESEVPRVLIAVRPDKVANVAVPAYVVAATDRAVMVLREPPEDADVHYGIRVLATPYRHVDAIELGERLLRGTFKLAVGPRPRAARATFNVHEDRGELIEIPYHTLDEPIFLELWHAIRDGADI